MIQFEKVTKKYGARAVLNNVDLKINPGEFVSVIGPSGAGKSTLIYALIGAEKLDKGTINVEGFAVNKMSPKQLQYYRRRIGVVFQDYKLLPQKTVYENVAFALEVCGATDLEIAKRVPEVLQFVGLAKQSQHFPNQLSGGEKQRTAIARALIHNPGLIVADEPTGNLDPDTALGIIDLLLKINKEGVIVILTTHNKELVNYVNKRVVVLSDGKIQRDVSVGQYNE